MFIAEHRTEYILLRFRYLPHLLGDIETVQFRMYSQSVYAKQKLEQDRSSE